MAGGLVAAVAFAAGSITPALAHSEFDASSRPEIVGGVKPVPTQPTALSAKEIFPQPESPAPALAAKTDGVQSAAAVSAPVPLPPTVTFRPVWPLRGEITTYFGEVGPTSPHGHTGLDIATDWGTPVAAAADGTVVDEGDTGDGYGTKVIVDHAGGFETWYGHLSSASVEVGDTVKQGQVIGREGSTGYSTGPHLHFEVHEGDERVDPLAFLPQGAIPPGPPSPSGGSRR